MRIAHCVKAGSFILGVALLAGLSVATQAGAQERAFLLDLNTKELTELDIPGNNSIVSPFAPPKIGLAINDNGQVAGYVLDEDLVSKAFITGFDGIGTTELGGLSERYHFTLPFDINNTGQVVGESPNNQGIRRAFITGQDGTGMRDLGALEGGFYSFAYGINNAAQVVGQSQVIRGEHAFITGPDGVGMRDLGGGSSVAYDINDSGQAVGFSSTHVFITGPDGVGMTAIEPLDDRSPSISLEHQASPSINNSGQVAGSALVFEYEVPCCQSFAWHAFITGPNGAGVTDLGTLGGSESFARGVNDAGQVIGAAETSAGINHAFITGLDGKSMTDLNLVFDLPDGVILTEAMGINNVGQVIAIGVIPEPESYVMFFAGLGLIGLMTRRERLLG